MTITTPLKYVGKNPDLKKKIADVKKGNSQMTQMLKPIYLVCSFSLKQIDERPLWMEE